jgi:hypothetical protein
LFGFNDKLCDVSSIKMSGMKANISFFTLKVSDADLDKDIGK